MPVAETIQPFLCGGVSAMMASCFVHPVDLAKVRLQLLGAGSKTKVKASSFSVLQNMVKTEGVASIYSGLSAALFRQASYGTARIGLFQIFCDKLKELNGGQPIPFYQKAAAGMAGGAIAVCIGTPCDVALVRMQADSAKPKAEQRGYKNVFDALARVAKEEGVANLWRGLAPNILRGMTMNAGMMASYDQSKEMVIEYITKDADASQPSLATRLLSACVAGFNCAFFSIPFDMIKSRLQDMKPCAVTGELPYTGIADCATKIIKNEGALTFWRGFGAFYMRSAPHAMIVLLSRDKITSIYRDITGLNDI